MPPYGPALTPQVGVPVSDSALAPLGLGFLRHSTT